MTEHKKTAERISRVFAPLKEGHWAVGTSCAVCFRALAVDDATTLVACATTTESSLDAPPREANVRALVAHASCTT